MSRNTIRDSQIIKRKILNVKYLLVDCDGVLSENKFYYNSDGYEVRNFAARDLTAVSRLRELTGIDTGLINDRNSFHLELLAKQLNAKEVYFGKPNKKEILLDISNQLQLDPEQIAYIGDDLDDLEAMQAVGFSVCPLDAVYEVRALAVYVCNSCGGDGVLREVAELFIAIYSESKNPKTLTTAK